MTATCHRVGHLVTQIQNDFLDRPEQALTLAEACTRFGIDAETARALFDLFVEAGALAEARRNGEARFHLRGSRRYVAAA